jgi:hypothetical protein
VHADHVGEIPGLALMRNDTSAERLIPEVFLSIRYAYTVQAVGRDNTIVVVTAPPATAVVFLRRLNGSSCR